MVLTVTTLEDFKKLIEGDKPVVIDFWATWCGPCKVMSPLFERFEAQFPNIIFAKVDVDEAEAISLEVGVRAMPTFILFKNGQKIKEVVGANPPALNELLKSAA